MPSDAHITVRDWRRRPALRLRVTKKLDIHWCWIKCTRCPHMRAVAIAPYVIRWGPDGWRDMLRRVGRCTKCSTKGVALQHPSWDASGRALASFTFQFPLMGERPRLPEHWSSERGAEKRRRKQRGVA